MSGESPLTLRDYACSIPVVLLTMPGNKLRYYMENDKKHSQGECFFFILL